MSEVTRILSAIEQGEPHAAEQLAQIAVATLLEYIRLPQGTGCR
jgi:hypothetical protein